MVHQTIASKMTNASNASNKIRPMQAPRFLSRRPPWSGWLFAAIVGTFAGCSVTPVRHDPVAASPSSPGPVIRDITPQLPALLLREQSRWVPVQWSDLPGLDTDAINEAWPAWLQSCQRPGPDWKALCPEIAQLAHAPVAQQRRWMRDKLQPYRVESHEQRQQGLLTGYYEPALTGSRRPQGAFKVPLFAPPAQLGQRKPWFSRQEIDTLPAARAALRGKELLYLADPVDAMVLHIQGSGLVNVTEPDGRQRWVRMAYAATNDQPYKSIGRWLLSDARPA